MILPDWQGLGLGSRLSDAGGEICRLQGREYFGQTVHPRFGQYRDRSPLWTPTEWNHDVQKWREGSWKERAEGTKTLLRQPRLIYSHRYTGAQNEQGQRHLEDRIVVHD